MSPSKRIPFAILLCLCLTAPFLWVLALPPLRIGVWGQAEGLTEALHVYAAIAGASFCWLVASGDRRARDSLLHPVPLVLFAVAAWSFACAPFVADPAMSVVGHPEHGVGGLWHAEAALLAASYLFVQQQGRKPVAAALLGSTASLAALNWWAYSPNGGFVPYDWLEYLGIMGVLAATAAAMAWPTRACRVAAVAIMLFAVWLSVNKTVKLTLIVAALMASPPVWRRISSVGRRQAAAMVATLAVILSLSVFAAGSPLERLTASVIPPAVEAAGVPGAAIEDHVDMHRVPWGTVWFRSMMWRVAVDAIEEQPSALAGGFGWGDFRDIVVREGRSVPGRAAENGTAQSGLTYWDARGKAGFHSHNVFLEALISGGAVACLLTLALFAAPPLAARRRHVPFALVTSACMAIIGSFWFLPNSLTPFLAAALVATSTPAHGRAVAIRLGRAGDLMAAATVLVFMAIAATVAVTSIGPLRQETMASDYAGGHVVLPPGDCTTIRGPFTPEAPINTKLYVMAAARVAAAPDPAAEILQNQAYLAHMACGMRGVIQRHKDAATLDTVLRARLWLTNWTADPEQTVEMMPNDLGLFLFSDISKLLQAAPKRTDILATWAAWSLRHGRPDAARVLASQWRTMPQGDPVRLWLQGRLALSSGDRDGADMVRRALRDGVSDWVDVGDPSKATEFSAGGTR